MRLVDSLRVALSSLLGNQLRTLLSTLGIAIGIAACLLYTSPSPRD